MDDIELLMTYAKTLGIGLLIGLEREGHPETKAGLRTFALIALSGTLFAQIGQFTGTPWLLAVVATLIGAMLIAAYSVNRAPSSDAGTTTVIAAIVTFGLGAALWYGYSTLAVALSIVITTLLYFRSELHGVSKQLTRRDYVSFLQFAVLAFILLPILPDRTYDPFGALNPYRTGVLVLMISGVSLAGYAALRFFGERRGALLAGIFGGIASTTATTLAFSRQVRQDQSQTSLSSRIILIANLVLYLRISIFVIVVAPALLKILAPVFAGGLLSGGAFLFWQTRHHRSGDTQNPPHTDIQNPADLRMAIGFAALFSGILFLVSWINRHLGMAGVYVAAFIAGLTDLDAISLSTLRLLNSGEAMASQAALAIMVAFVANLMFKFGITAIAGSRPLARIVGEGFVAMCAGMALGWLVTFAI